MRTFDPIWEIVPPEQAKRVFEQDMCDIDPEFLGFTDIYLSLSSIIPKHWTVVDLGCAYSPQALIFADHRAYIGVDLLAKERFSAPNTKHVNMPIEDFIRKHGADFDQDRTFAICSYVPNWHGENSRLAREFFKNVFTFYPSRDTVKASAKFLA